MKRKSKLFDNLKACGSCNRPLPADYEGDYCPRCQENLLFQQVKEYIRDNVVNEKDVAEHFNISVKQVKKWIKEGRIEYNATSLTQSLAGLTCANCGAPISFGSFCNKCRHDANKGKGYATQPLASDTDSQMRFLDFEDNES